MHHVLGRSLVLLGKLLLLPILLIDWLVEAITGERRRLEEKRRAIEERPPLSDEAFLERAGVAPEDVPVALATRRAVAEACRLPDTALCPEDSLVSLRWLMTPGPDARWLDLGPDWLEVVVGIIGALDVRVSGDVLDVLDERWKAAEREGEANLGQLIGWLADSIRAARAKHDLNDRSR
jgi:hypothetical protein